MSAHVAEVGTNNANRQVAGVVLLIAAGLPVAGILTAGIRRAEVAPGLIDWVFVAAIVIVTLATFGLMVPRVQRLAKHRALGVALAMALVGLALLPIAFWTMLPLIIGSAGAWIAYTVSGDGRRTGVAWAGIVIGGVSGLLSAVGYVVSSFVDVPTL